MGARLGASISTTGVGAGSETTTGVGSGSGRLVEDTMGVTLCEFSLGSVCYRGGCQQSETEIARIYVRSLCRWAVAPTLA